MKTGSSPYHQFQCGYSTIQRAFIIEVSKNQKQMYVNVLGFELLKFPKSTP